jgi:hypothetical protein
MRLKMAGWDCSRSKLAKIECGLITVRDRDLPHFLNASTTSIETLYAAEVFKRLKAIPFQNSAYFGRLLWLIQIG